MTNAAQAREPRLSIKSGSLHCECHPRGAAISRLIHKPLKQDILLRLRTHDRIAPHHYTNTVVGPIANRISGAQFSIDGERFSLDKNEGENCLHGGRAGLSECAWEIEEAREDRIIFALSCADGHMGFPGPARFRAIYKVRGACLEIMLEATSARRNYFNLAPHLYLKLDGSPNIDRHLLQITADHYLPVDHEKIPLAEPAPVQGSDFDFRKATEIGTRPIDQNFCLDIFDQNTAGMDESSSLREVAMLQGDNGLFMRLSTDQPGLQIYTRDHGARSHLAMEPQDWPDRISGRFGKVNYTDAGAIYRARTQLEFGII